MILVTLARSSDSTRQTALKPVTCLCWYLLWNASVRRPIQQQVVCNTCLHVLINFTKSRQQNKKKSKERRHREHSFSREYTSRTVKHERPSQLPNTKIEPTFSSGSTSLLFLIFTILPPKLLNLSFLSLLCGNGTIFLRFYRSQLTILSQYLWSRELNYIYGWRKIAQWDLHSNHTKAFYQPDGGILYISWNMSHQYHTAYNKILVWINSHYPHTLSIFIIPGCPT
jgi:hypothetical protein